MTIYDIAREADVAASTVSRALSHPDRVSEKTRTQIRAVAERLGYRPNPMARALPSGQTQTVALLVSDITNPHFFNVIRGAERRATADGFTLVLGNADESAEVEQRHVERLARGVDGFVLAASRMSDDQILELAAEMPVALVNRRVDGVASAVIDQRHGTNAIIDHLAGLGHRRIVFLAGPDNSYMAAQRWRTLSTATDERGLHAVRLGPFVPKMEGGADAADAAEASGATAIIAHNDLLAMGVLRRFRERGIAVPSHRSVVGFDDTFGADFCPTPLTTLTGPVDEAAATATDMVLARIMKEDGSPDHQQVTLPSTLIMRQSTGPAPS